jgi:type I restriction enzyme S subunit
MRDVLPEDWPLATLEDVATIFDCPHSTPRLTISGPFVARSQDIRSGVFRTDLAARVSEDTYLERVRRAEPRHGDLLFSREGTYFGIAAEVPTNIRVCLGQRMVLIRPDERVQSRFLRYWLNSSLMGDYASGFHDGSVAQRLNVSTIRRLPVPLPQPDEQKRIADLLGALDEKIALNRRLNRMLEDTAAALFRSWFVNFDPVVAKAEGRRATGVPLSIHEAMPASLVDSPAGDIPRGWRVGRFDEMARVIREQVPGGEIDAGTPYIAMEHMPRQSIALDTWDAAGRIDSAKSRYAPGDVLFGKLRPYFHKVGIAPNAGVCSTEILVMRPVRPEWYGLIVCGSSSREFVEYASGAAEGTRMPRVSWDYLARYSVVLPDLQTAGEFTDVVRPIFDRIIENVHESRSLSAVRDSLLPQILSGSMRLGAAERTVTVALQG